MTFDSKLKTFFKPHTPTLSKRLSTEDEIEKKTLIAQWKAWGYKVTEDEDVYGVTIRGVKYQQNDPPLSAA